MVARGKVSRWHRLSGAWRGPALPVAIFAGATSLAVIFGTPGCSVAQSASDSDVQVRLQRLEQQVTGLSNQLATAKTAAGGGGGLGSAAAGRIDERLSALETELRALNGQVEELDYRVRRLSDRVDKVTSDNELRLSKLEGSGAAASSSAAPAQAQQPEAASPPRAAAPTVAVPPPPPPATPTPAEQGGPRPLGAVPSAATQPPTAPPAGQDQKGQYDYALGLLRQGKYDEAETAFKTYVDRYPDGPLIDNARYWLGESYYARGRYPQAAEAFLDAYEKSQKGPKAPDVLLKLGMTLANLNKKPEACATWQRLTSEFPNASAAIKDDVAQKRRQLACP